MDKNIFSFNNSMDFARIKLSRNECRTLVPVRSKILIIISFNFSVSDFTHALSKAHEQHAEDLSNLVEDFRTKNVELLRDR